MHILVQGSECQSGRMKRGTHWNAFVSLDWCAFVTMNMCESGEYNDCVRVILHVLENIQHLFIGYGMRRALTFSGCARYGYCRE